MPASPRINRSDAHAIDEFIRNLEETSEQVQRLLDDVHENEVDFAAIKTELRILCENVKELSSILRDGDGKVSVVTKIALVEQKVIELEKSLEKKEKKGDEESSVDKAGSWQMKVALITGGLGLVAGIVNILIQSFVK